MKSNIMNFQQIFQKSNIKNLKEFLAYKHEYFNTVYQILRQNENEPSLDVTCRQVVFMIESVLYY